MQKPLRVFCSYSHRDEYLRKEFEPYFGVLSREGLVSPWYDRMIDPGDEWAAEISENLDGAHLILLFVSVDFIASRYCYEIEMRRAMEMHDARKARVVPIIVRPTPLSGTFDFERLQMLPGDAQPVTAFADREIAWSAVTKALRDVIQKMLSEPVPELRARRVKLECRSAPNELVCVFDRSATIGRSATCDIAVPQAPASVSKTHARFFFDDDSREFLIDDLDSRNGTWVDGERVRMKRLRLGSALDLGRGLRFTFWRYDRAGQTAGVLVYKHGDDELARYVLVPGGEVSLGTGTADALRLPLLSDGRTIGALASEGGNLFYTPAERPERMRLRDGATIDGRALQVAVRILE
jgi:hypothetical protein